MYLPISNLPTLKPALVLRLYALCRARGWCMSQFVEATRQCWSVGMEGGDAFLKFGRPSSRCKSYPANAEPGKRVASLAPIPGNGVGDA